MKLFLIIIFFLIKTNLVFSQDNLIFYLDVAYKNNPKLNAERKNFKATKENINISRSEFLPSLSLSGSVNSDQSSKKTNPSGVGLSNSSNNKETKTISVDQKIFQGFQGYNSYKKSQLEVEQAKFKLQETEQNTIFDAASVYFDLIYKTNSKKFNLSNVNIFERQVETDSIRLQKGEITLTDLAQSESSLAGAKAKSISADTELLSAKTNFVRITTKNAPDYIKEDFDIKIQLPDSLTKALVISKNNNPKLMMKKIEYEISQRNLKIEKSQLSPSASINYSKSESNDYSSTIDEIEDESVKATITWPIIKGGKNYSSIKKSKFKKEQSNLILEDTVNEVVNDVTNSWSLYQSAGSVLRATEAQVQAAEIANEGITLEYDSGNTRTTLEVIQSRSLLLEARIAKAKSERDFVISKFKLMSELGILTLENIKNSNI